jgi:hypothetical protein
MVGAEGNTGGTDFRVGDYIRYNGSSWEKYAGVGGVNLLDTAIGALCTATEIRAAGLCSYLDGKINTLCATGVDYTPLCSVAWTAPDPVNAAEGFDRLAAAFLAHTGLPIA